MAFFFNSGFAIQTTICLFLLCTVSVSGAAMDPRFELDPAAISGSSPSTKKPAVKIRKYTKAKRHKKTYVAEKTPPVSENHEPVYIVKPGDHLFKILMRYYGLSNDKAKSSIDDIKRENNIVDVRKLRIGQKITISLARRTVSPLQMDNSAQTVSDRLNPAETAGQSFLLEPPAPMLTEQEVVGRIRDTWDKIVPGSAEPLKPPDLQTSSFSVTLDAQRYPSFAAIDGGRILLDQGGAIPPAIKTLMQEKEPKLRIVSDPPSGTRGFLSSMLEAGGFYSVEENFNAEFGVDPKLSVHADFKIEKSADSLGKQDVVLMNSTLRATPATLIEFLKKEGFTVFEPFAFLKQQALRSPRPLYQVTAKKQSDIVDAILKIFSVSFDRNRRLDVFAADNKGISLAFKAERYFERGGQRFVIISLDGDPINTPLLKVLEANDFRVIILEAQDDFRKISEKIIAGMKLKGIFDRHNLLLSSTANYSLQISGFNLDDPSLPGGGLFMTNLEMNRVVRELLAENGYNIQTR